MLRRFPQTVLTICILVTAAVVIFGPGIATALVVDFSTPFSPGNTGINTYTSGPVTAEAYYKPSSGADYTNANATVNGVSQPLTLFERHNPDDHGFGVCSPKEQTNSACRPPATYTGGGGNVNELDNLGKSELIRLTLADGYHWLNVWISSLDSSEKGQIWYTTARIRSPAI